MSIENIKEIFGKRVSEAHKFNPDPKDCPATDSKESGELHVTKNNFTSLKEEQAGITEYLTKVAGFNAVIKERFSDFQVHEIDLDGNVVSLTNFDIPDVLQPATNESNDILEPDIWDKLNDLYEKKITTVEIDVTAFDKDKRRCIHKCIKAKYKKAVTTNTVICSDSEKKTIVVTLNNDGKDSWPMEYGDYLHFVLFKTNIDTLDAINTIASKLATKASNLTYAGTKDKRGKTSQQVCMWHLKAERLNSLNNSLRHMRVGNFSYKKNPLKLGDLKGNHFKIALRNVTADNDIVICAFETLKQNGFINYFGLQRFGNSPQVPTFTIGKCLVKGDFKCAVELILKPRYEGRGKDDLGEAKKIWWDTKDAKKAYGVLKSRNKTHEGKLLHGLVKHGPNAYVNALDEIPRNVRLLYLHSYQSLLWNKIVSKRIKEFGSSVLEGDLVYTKKIDEVSLELSEEDIDKGKSPKENEIVKCITAEEVKSYEIFDIVHPLPGYDVTYPNNIIKTWYEELLEEEGLTTEEFKQRVKIYRLSGTYRSIVKKPKDLTWNITYYTKPEDDLILSDLDIINNDTSNYCFKDEGKFKAVIINFSLDSSTYATMAIREVLKIDTSSGYQASLNSYSNKRILAEGGNTNDEIQVDTKKGKFEGA